VPVWSDHYQTHLTLAIGILSTLYDEARMHREVAPEMLELAHAIGGLSNAIADDRSASRDLAMRAVRTPNKTKKDSMDDLAART
jgi:hypothetical protein